MSLRGARAFSRDFTAHLARQCQAVSRALKIKKLKAPIFPGLKGAGDTNDWRINTENDFEDKSHPMRTQTICICENKDADQLRGNREADQSLCFRYSDSTISLLLKSCFCDCTALFVTDMLVTQIVGFLTHRLIILFLQPVADTYGLQES